MEAKIIMARAANLLRDAADHDEDITAMVIACATFMGMTKLPWNAITDEFKDNVRFKKLLLDAADTLQPICPHCLNALDKTPQSTSEAKP